MNTTFETNHTRWLERSLWAAHGFWHRPAARNVAPVAPVGPSGMYQREYG